MINKKQIANNINKGWNFQPLLFMWNNLELLSKEIDDLSTFLFNEYWVDKLNYHTLRDDGEVLKVEHIRNFIWKSFIKTSQKFQIFFIENISRCTTQSYNAMLKFLEEPCEWNIVFLSNKSESWVLETILSRVKKINILTWGISDKNDFFIDIIIWFLSWDDEWFYRYFFDDKKLEKDDYISFFNTFLYYINTYNTSYEYMPQIEKSLNNIIKNNALPKLEIDKLILHKRSLN